MEDKELVDEFERLQNLKNEIDLKLEKIKQDIINLAVQKAVNKIEGSEKICFVKPYVKVIYPQDKTVFLELVRDKGYFDECSYFNYLKFSTKIVKGDVDKEILELIRKDKGYRVSLVDR